MCYIGMMKHHNMNITILYLGQTISKGASFQNNRIMKSLSPIFELH